MLSKKSKKELDNSTLASVKKELAKPRLAKSARIGTSRSQERQRLRLVAEKVQAANRFTSH
jgi:hypothetical protein